MKKITSLLGVLLVSSVSYAELDLKFDDVDSVDSLQGVAKAKNSSIEEGASGKYLKVANPRSIFKIKTNTKASEGLNCNFDWHSNNITGTSGTVFALTEVNHNNKFLQLTLDRGKLKASSFAGGKLKSRRLFKPQADRWYRFAIEVKNGAYTLVVKERGKKNDQNGDVAYSSIEAKKTFMTNQDAKPRIVLMNTWGKKAGTFYEYDNITVAE